MAETKANASKADAQAGDTAPRHGRDYSYRVSLALLARLLSPYKGMVAGSLVLLLCDMVGMLVVPTELSALVNTAIGSRDTAELVRHGALMLGAAIMGSGGCVASYAVVSRLAAYVGRDLRVAIYGHTLSFSDSDFGRFGTGSMVTRTLGDVNVVQQTLLMSFMMLVPVPVACVVAIVLAWSIDPVMGRLLVWITLALVAVMALAVHATAPIFLILQNFVDRMNTRLRESITGVRVIRAFGKEPYERARLDRTFEEYARDAIHVNYVFAATDSITFCLMNLVEVLVIWLGADRVGAGAMEMGSVTALVQYAMIIMFFTMMAQFAILQLPRALACLTRASEVLSAEPAIKDPATPAAPVAGQEVVARFRDVSFRFDDASEDTLHHLSFAIRRGQTCAIIGSTGSGKSTVAKLLLRLHDVTTGSLELFGRDARDLAQAQLRARVAYVPQKAWLFSGTIADNLRDGCEDATDEQLWHALDVAQGSFVRELPEGLGARVAQGGSNFSGGQRQRLAMARALVRKADLYIFDDAFSALDYKTDAALRHALKGELADAAVLIIAQRVSTIRDADQIVVLSEGRVVGVGTHEELLGSCDTYRDIYESQTRGGEA